MSLLKPIRNSPITSTKPIIPARSMTANGTGLPRNYSTRLKKM
jgi:hypothetical protein